MIDIFELPQFLGSDLEVSRYLCFRWDNNEWLTQTPTMGMKNLLKYCAGILPGNLGTGVRYLCSPVFMF